VDKRRWQRQQENNLHDVLRLKKINFPFIDVNSTLTPKFFRRTQDTGRKATLSEDNITQNILAELILDFASSSSFQF